MGLGQNGVVLSFFEPKRRRFGFANFFLKLCLYQNDVVLDKTASKQRRFGAAFKYPKQRRFAVVMSKTTSFWLLFKKKIKKEMTSFCLWKKRNDVVSYGRLPKNEIPYSSLPVCSNLGGGGGEGRLPPTARCVGDLTFNEGSGGGR